MATLALGQDAAFGQPLESQLRSAILADALCEAAGLDAEMRATAYWLALLRYVGCTGHAREVSAVFGDDVAAFGKTLLLDAANPAEMAQAMVEAATAGHPPEEHEAIASAIVQGGHQWSVQNFSIGCEVGAMLIEHLGLEPHVRDAFRFTYERWNGAGYPAGARGASIPLAMRVVHLAHDMEAIARMRSPAAAIAAARERSNRTYDPMLAELFVTRGAGWLAHLDTLDPWDEVLRLEPHPRRLLQGGALDEALGVAADFVELKSPFMAGHSRRCATLAAEAARAAGLDEEAVDRVRRAALVHELGMAGIPNSILDKAGPLTRTERDRIGLHPLVTAQILRRSPALDRLMPIAAAHHERQDGSGYHRGLAADRLEPGSRILAAVEIWVGLTAERADRPAFPHPEAAAELRRLSGAGLLDARTTEIVLLAAGQGASRQASMGRAALPGGLSRREAEVLRLAARGLTTREIADRLFISPKTADHHIQHAYTKIGVSSRAAAALWAMQHGIMGEADDAPAPVGTPGRQAAVAAAPRVSLITRRSG